MCVNVVRSDVAITSCDDVIPICRASGHGEALAALALDLSLPAATQLRQHALALHLRRALPGARAAGVGAGAGGGGAEAPWAPGGFVTDLKAAARLALGQPVAAALGAALASDAPVRPMRLDGVML